MQTDPFPTMFTICYLSRYDDSSYISHSSLHISLLCCVLISLHLFESSNSPSFRCCLHFLIIWWVKLYVSVSIIATLENLISGERQFADQLALAKIRRHRKNQIDISPNDSCREVSIIKQFSSLVSYAKVWHFAVYKYNQVDLNHPEQKVQFITTAICLRNNRNEITQ